MKKILVIKLSALGDFFAATSAFEAIRNHHKDSRLILLTTPPFENLARQLGYFDEIWLDERPKFSQIGKFWKFIKRLRAQSFDRVYDLQMVDRTNLYFYFMRFGHSLEWVGTALGASHRYVLPKEPTYHQLRLKNLLEAADVSPLPPLNLTRLAGNITNFPVKFPYVIFAPGASAAHRHIKCWPLERYGEVAKSLVANGLTPVIVGGPDENNEDITNLCPQAIDLTGKTKLLDMITLATHASFAIGNDTGPMHIAATCQCPVLVLFFGPNNPIAVGPRGLFYRHLYAQTKEMIPTEQVLDILPDFIEPYKNRPHNQKVKNL